MSCKRLIFVGAILLSILAFSCQNNLENAHFASNNALTGKEQCVKSVVNMYKHHYIPYIIRRKAKKILQLYRLERKLRAYSKRMRNSGNEDLSVPDWRSSEEQVDTTRRKGETRRLTMRRRSALLRRRKFRNAHLRAFIKRMGYKMKLFGKVYKPKELRNYHKLIKKISRNWFKTLTHGKWYNQESVDGAAIERMLIHQYSLKMRYQQMLTHCHLNMTPSIERCEHMHGKGECSVLYSGVVHRKCPPGMVRVGCCSCATPCPSGLFKEDFFFCARHRRYKLDRFHLKSECEATHKKCHEYHRSFIPDCKEGFSLQPHDGSCLVNCPHNWKQMNNAARCLKPTIISLGTPFVWIKADN